MPSENELVQPLGEKGQYSDDGATLDDNVEQIALTGQPLFGNEQVGGGRDGQKFGDPLDDTENYDGKPIGHRLYRDKKREDVKSQKEINGWQGGTATGCNRLAIPRSNDGGSMNRSTPSDFELMDSTGTNRGVLQRPRA